MTNIRKVIETIDSQRVELDEQRNQWQYYMKIKEEYEGIVQQIKQLTDRELELRKVSESPNESEVTKHKLLAEAATIKEKIIDLETIKMGLEQKLSEIDTEEKNKHFDKYLAFSNIRELLKSNDVKIGAIEKEAKCQPGYMSRLDKPGNASEPSVEFIVTAAQLLKVSIDTLVSVNLTELTPTEQYIVNFFDKLKADTLKDKLDWNRETAFNLNRIEPDIDGCVYHPLFAEETFYEETECEYPEEVTRIVFNSKTFGPHTNISGDCFNLRLKNGTTLYLMDIEKSVHRTGDISAYAKEAWMYVPYKGCQLLVASQDNTPVAHQLEVLFSVVKDRMEHPQINNDVMFAIDSFMNDDLSDDTDDIPF